MTATATATTVELTTEPAHVLAHYIRRSGHKATFVQPDGTLRLVAHNVSDGMITFERVARRLAAHIAIPATYEIRVRNTADRHIDKATGGRRDERTGDIVVTVVPNCHR